MTTSSHEAWSFEELFKNLAEGKTSAGEPTLPDEGSKFPGAEQINPQSEKQKLGVSENNGTPKSSILLIGISIINRPFWGPPIFGNTQLEKHKLVKLDHVTTIFVSPTNSLKPSKTKPDRNQVIQFNSWPNIDLPDPEGGHLRRH